MTPSFTDKLRAAKEAAEKADQNQWQAVEDGMIVFYNSDDPNDYEIVIDESDRRHTQKNHIHIATMCPKFTLELIERYEKMRAIISELFDALNYELTNYEMVELDQKVRKLLQELEK